ncbi:MAG: CHAD domain-containing protein [Pseudomonadota bacterium]
MAYSFRLADRTLAQGVRRISDAQLSCALATIADPALTLDRKVHAVRRRIKKVRALIRLIRPSLPSYTDENRRLRDAARRLGPARDAAVMLETFDRALSRAASPLDGDLARRLRGRLVGARQAMSDAEIGAALLRTEIDLRGCHERLRDPTLTAEEAPAFEAGFARVYRRSVKMMRQARRTRDAEDIHEWRKWAKYHWLHTRLLRHAWPEGLELRSAHLDQLTDDLGEHHDLSVLYDLLTHLLVEGEAVDTFLEASVKARLVILEARALDRGEDLFAEEPKVFARRCGAYWSVWRQNNPVSEPSA